MTANVGGIDRTLRIVVGIVLIALFFLLEGPVRYVGLLGLVALVDRARQLLSAVYGARDQHLPDEEGLSPSGSRDRRRHPAAQLLRAHRARLPRHLAAALEHDQRRDAADPEARGDVLRLLRVQLREPDVRLHALRGFLDRPGPSSGTVRTTVPRSPRPRAGRSVPTCWSKLPLESSTGCPREKRLVTAGAARAVAAGARPGPRRFHRTAGRRLCVTTTWALRGGGLAKPLQGTMARPRNPRLRTPPPSAQRPLLRAATATI